MRAATLVVFALAMAACSQGSAIDDDDGRASGKWIAAGGAPAGGAGGSGNTGVATGGAPNHSATTGGTAGSGNVPFDDVCDPYAPRTQIPELLIGPSGLETKLLGLIDQAKLRVDVMMYQLSRQSFITALIAAHERGVVVRVLVDAAQNVNGSAISQLQSAGVDVRDAPSSFEHAHAKIIFVDDVAAVVMSANLNAYSMVSERNYGIVNRDPADLDDIARIFEADFEGGARLALDCTRLIVSPVNAEERLLTFIGGAQATLDLAVMYLSDSQLKKAVKGRAQAGVVVRVLLADPAWISSNPNTAADLAAAGVAVRYLKAWELHAKLIVADSTAFIGSENLSWTALNKNREIGVLVTEAAPAASVASQFSQDWAAGVTAP